MLLQYQPVSPAAHEGGLQEHGTAAGRAARTVPAAALQQAQPARAQGQPQVSGSSLLHSQPTDGNAVYNNAYNHLFILHRDSTQTSGMSRAAALLDAVLGEMSHAFKVAAAAGFTLDMQDQLAQWKVRHMYLIYYIY